MAPYHAGCCILCVTISMYRRMNPGSDVRDVPTRNPTDGVYVSVSGAPRSSAEPTGPRHHSLARLRCLRFLRLWSSTTNVPELVDDDDDDDDDHHHHH